MWAAWTCVCNLGLHQCLGENLREWNWFGHIGVFFQLADRGSSFLFVLRWFPLWHLISCCLFPISSFFSASGSVLRDCGIS